MKSKQILDVQQMQHLQELGLELKESLLYWARCVDNNPRAATHYGKWVLIKGNNAQTVGLMQWEFIHGYTQNGLLVENAANELDLMMLPEKKEGWVNVYDADTTFYFVEGRVYDTKEEAIKHIIPDHEIYTTTVKIEWEE